MAAPPASVTLVSNTNEEFCVPLEVALASPFIADMCDSELHDDDNRIPLPSVASVALGDVCTFLHLLHAHKGSALWSIACPLPWSIDAATGKRVCRLQDAGVPDFAVEFIERFRGEADRLVRMASAADDMRLDILQGLCFAFAAQQIKIAGPEAIQKLVPGSVDWTPQENQCMASAVIDTWRIQDTPIGFDPKFVAAAQSSGLFSGGAAVGPAVLDE